MLSIKDFVLDCLLVEKEENMPLYQRVQDYEINNEELYKRDWFTDLFWECVEGIEHWPTNEPYKYITTVTRDTDLEHQKEYLTLVISRVSDGQLLGIDFESSEHNGNTFYNRNGYFKPMKSEKVSITQYTFI